MKKKILKNIHIALAGILASLGMFLFIYIGIHVTGVAPFNIQPSAAFLFNLGIYSPGYALLLHFCYGTFWSFVLVYTFEDDVTIGKAVILSIILWLFMMLVYSPIIGWGLFGFGYFRFLPSDHPLYLKSGISYMIITLFLHLIYGLILGYLNQRWLRSYW